MQRHRKLPVPGKIWFQQFRDQLPFREAPNRPLDSNGGHSVKISVMAHNKIRYMMFFYKVCNRFV